MRQEKIETWGETERGRGGLSGVWAQDKETVTVVESSAEDGEEGVCGRTRIWYEDDADEWEIWGQK